MRRRQLFEFEDQAWLPARLRQGMTLYLGAFHRLFRTRAILEPLLERAIASARAPRVLDLCSGAGGPIPDVVRRIRAGKRLCDLELVLTDLYPNRAAMAALEARGEPWLRYEPTPVDAANVDRRLDGVRTMICSLHHLRPDAARRVLRDACEKRQPICVLELSDNSAPGGLRWLAVPAGFLLVLLLTPLVRPLRPSQLLWTYALPVLPLLIAWDGAASNARIYTEEDLRELLAGMECDDYGWVIGKARPRGAPTRMLYLLGLPGEDTDQTDAPPQRCAARAMHGRVEWPQRSILATPGRKPRRPWLRRRRPSLRTATARRSSRSSPVSSSPT